MILVSSLAQLLRNVGTYVEIANIYADISTTNGVLVTYMYMFALHAQQSFSTSSRLHLISVKQMMTIMPCFHSRLIAYSKQRKKNAEIYANPQQYNNKDTIL